MRYGAAVMPPAVMPVAVMPLAAQRRPRVLPPPSGRPPGLPWLLLLAALVLPAAPLLAAGPARSASSATATPTDARRFTVQGLAPVLAGLTLAQADQALGQPLLPEQPAISSATSATSARAATAAAGPAAPAACHYRTSVGLPGVRFVLRDGRLVRSETRDARYTTASGLRVGDALAQAEKLYGNRLESSRHPYFDHGRMLAIYAGDRKHALVFETNDQGRIITLRAGRVPEVLALEGCSG